MICTAGTLGLTEDEMNPHVRRGNFKDTLVASARSCREVCTYHYKQGHKGPGQSPSIRIVRGILLEQRPI